MSDLAVRAVNDRRGQMDFLLVPHHVFKDDPNWVAPLFFERLEHLNPNKNPYFKHAEVQLFVAYREGQPVGRISVQADSLRQKYHNDHKGLFGFLDSIDEPEIFRALTETAAQWLKAKGYRSMLGPFSFSINDETGMLINGFDSAPNMMMPHHRDYYQRHMETLGFVKAKDMTAHLVEIDRDFPPLMKRICDRSAHSGEYAVRPIDMSKIKDEMQLVMSLFNDAWSENWGFVPFTEAELDKLASDLKMLVNGNYAAIASYKGEPAAFIIALPNLNEWIKDFRGRLLPYNWVKLAVRVVRKRPTSARLPLMGIRKKYQSSAIGSALVALCMQDLHNYHRPRGVKTCELSWILEDNYPLLKMVEAFGARHYKTYRVYERAI